MLERYIDEALGAEQIIEQTHPDLGRYGWRTDESTGELPSLITHELAVALAFLDLSGARVKSRITRKDLTSYQWKHVAETWGQTAGLSPYVSNGAFIAALILRRVPFRRWIPDGPNCTPALTQAWVGLRGGWALVEH